MPALSLSAPELSEFALDEAISIVVGARAALAPFVITETAGERKVHRFDGGSAGQNRAAARFYLRTVTGIDRAALVWDGYVTTAGRRSDAVLVEYSEPGADASTISARRYRPARFFRPPVAVGATVAVGEGHPLF